MKEGRVASWLNRSAVVAATMGGLGFLPYRIVPYRKWKGSGLLGTLAAWALVWRRPESLLWTAGIFLLLTALAVAASHRAERLLTHDDPRIVIDEAAGIWLACLGLPLEMKPMLIALALFRVFDVFKGPWGRAAARLPGGWGIVADDLAAGLLAGLGTRLSIYVLG